MAGLPFTTSSCAYQPVLPVEATTTSMAVPPFQSTLPPRS